MDNFKAIVKDAEDCPLCLRRLFSWQCSKQIKSRGTYYHARESTCFFANPCLDCTLEYRMNGGGGEKNRGRGLEIAPYNNNRGVGIIGK